MPQPDWEELERRVARLERLVGVEEERPVAKCAERPAELSTPSVNVSTLLPILGRALLGLAGAYLLRALTESDSVPRAAGVTSGILYALLWLLWAARTPASDSLPAAIHSLTSALVFYPLLWEATVHFQAVPTWLGAGLLAGFVLLGIAVSWRRKLPIVSTIVTLGGLIAAAGLLLATRDVVPFTVVFLIVAAATETSTCMEHRVTQRWLVAAGADLAVWLATWLVAREHGLPEVYAAIPNSLLLGMQAALVGIYLASAIVRTLVRGLTFTWFETAQSAVVLLIGVGGGFWLSGGAVAIAGFALACATACYAVSFVVLDRAGNHGRNFYTYSTFGFLLLLSGSRAFLHGMAAYALWCALAVGCVWAGVRFGRVTLQVHGGIYLLLALAGSGGLTQVAGILLGSGTWSGEATLVLTVGMIAAGLCYWMASRNRDEEQLLSQLLAGVFIWMLAGLSAGAVAIACCATLGTEDGEAYSATLRTCSLVLLSLLLAWSGGRWSRPELSRLIYPAMILGAYRLVAVDFNQNRKLPLFLSLLAYGAVLIALPRLTRSPASSIS